MPRRLLLLTLLACALLPAADIELAAKSWIVAPGDRAEITATLPEGSAGATVACELRAIDGSVRWRDERKSAGRRIGFVVETGSCRPGDHTLRVAVLKGGQTQMARDHALMVALPDDVVLILDREPIARGLRHDSTGIKARQLAVDGASIWAHEAGFDSRHGAEGWWRSLLLTITDERLRNGKRPVAEIEVVYRHEADAPVELMADCAKGPREVAKGWGRNPGWQVLRANLEDARFSAPELDANPHRRLTDGCDIRFNANTGDGIIRSVRVHCPDAGNPSDWSRFLEADFASADGWVVAPGSDGRAAITVRNRAGGVWDGTLRVEVCDRGGRLLDAQERPLRVAAGKETTEEVTVPLRSRAEGEHLLRWRLLRGPKDNRKQDAGWERSCVVAGPRAAFVLFEREPITRGIDFDRQRIAPVQITSGGLKRWVWRLAPGSAEEPWWRSTRFTLGDAAFRDGAMPVVDVDVRARLFGDAPMTITADTDSGGGGRIAFGWGGRGPGYLEDPPWRGLHATLDDARFAARKHTGAPGDLLASGCDLRFNACAADGDIRSIVLLGHDRQKPDWKRMLRPLGVDLGSDRYVFAPGTPVTARLRLANRSLVPYRGTLTASFANDLEVESWRREIPVEIEPDKTAEIPIEIDTKGLPMGVYRLALRVDAHIETRTLFGLSDLAVLPKAKPGEFLYGADLGGTWRDTRKLDWADYMGIDILRNSAGGLDQLDEAVPVLRARGIQGTLMVDPPWDPDAGKRAKMAEDLAAKLEKAARTHADFLRWYELGNEPDLLFFYAGPIDAYIEGYRTMHAAIKRGDPDSVVMNGGLCYAGEEGWRRAHELIAKLPNELVDAWSYHGHGPGIKAERDAWERQDRAVRAVGKGGKPLLETESGLHAITPVELRRQAQTIVEKAIFAQSKGADFLLWFNLHMGESEWGYTTIEREREPRPAVLAHRAMVATLRGLRHVGTLDLAASGAEGHRFAAGDRRALVLWSDAAEMTRTIAIGPGCKDLRRIDLFGNATPEREVAAGQVRLMIGADPVYLTWTAGDAESVARVLPPALVAPARLRVVPGRPAQLALTVRNGGDQPLAARIATSVQGEAPIRIPEDATATVTPGTESAVTVPLEVAAVATSTWPRQWTVFAPVAGNVDLAGMTDIPRALGGVDASLRAQPGVPDGNGGVDLAPLAGGVKEKRQALCFAWLESETGGPVEIGTGADWWMEWWVNGERIGSTLDSGNGGAAGILNRTFTARLKPGRNLLAVRVLSGSGGFRLAAGGATEIAAARRAREGRRDALQVELHGADGMLAREQVVVEVLRPLDAVAGKPDWTALAPDGVLGAVANRYQAQPDETRWYRGGDDFSGRIWARAAADGLQVAIAVQDDLQKAGDRCVLRLAVGPTLSERIEVPLAVRRDDAAKLTWYTATVPSARLGADRFAIQVHAMDDDWGELKQDARWGEGDDPEGWFQAWIR